MKSGIIKRLILSIYHYEKKAEDRIFFDAWWQFFYTLSYTFLGFLFFATNVILGILNLKINLYIYLILTILVTVGTNYYNDFRNTPFYEFVLAEYKNIVPIPRWILWGIAIILILLLGWSMDFNIKMAKA